MAGYDKLLAECASQTPYPVEAFLFVRRGLAFTVNHKHGELTPEQEEAAMQAQTEDNDATHSRHVSGRDLALGLRDLAIKEYGLLARTVLKRWNIHRSEDFGKIVFAMVEAGLMLKTDDDGLDDFKDVFDFREAFATPKLELSRNLKVTSHQA